MNMFCGIDLDKEISLSKEEKEALIGHISGEDDFSRHMSPEEVEKALSFISSDKPLRLDNDKILQSFKEELALHKEILKISHYDFRYKLTKADIEKGEIKLDPYFISKQWDLGSKDPSGVIFHCLKTIARWGTKNSVEREIQAMEAQIKRLKELTENVF
jgi:hypothetical protein